MARSRVLHFTQITDDRFDDNIKELLEARIDRLSSVLDVEGVESLNITDPREVNFETNRQYRTEFYLTKNRKITWNEIYRLVNSVKAVPYRFI